jgi:dihydrodipicolinate synthase/N-acetylneuraminate lyase
MTVTADHGFRETGTARRMPATILATCVLPWDRHLRFLEEEFRDHVRLVAENVTRHIYVFGTAGEGYAMTDGQFREIAAVFWDQAQASGVTPMLGVISNSLGTVVERIEFGIETGFREFQISFPSWGAVSEAERDAFFRETCGRFRGARFLHYNIPRGRRVLTGAEYRELARRHRNLAAVKFSSSDSAVVRELVTGCGPLQCFLTEPAYVLARDYVRCGLLVSLSGVRTDLPQRFTAADGTALHALGDLAYRIDDLLEECFRETSPQAHMDGAYEKVIARAHGARLPLRLLPPFEGASEEGCRRFLAGLRSLPGLDPDRPGLDSDQVAGG